MPSGTLAGRPVTLMLAGTAEQPIKKAKHVKRRGAVRERSFIICLQSGGLWQGATAEKNVNGDFDLPSFPIQYQSAAPKGTLLRCATCSQPREMRSSGELFRDAFAGTMGRLCCVGRHARTVTAPNLRRTLPHAMFPQSSSPARMFHLEIAGGGKLRTRRIPNPELLSIRLRTRDEGMCIQ